MVGSNEAADLRQRNTNTHSDNNNIKMNESNNHTNTGSSSSSSSSSNSSSNGDKNINLPVEDQLSIALLLLLYTLQGIPMGLCGSIPMLLKERGVSYEALSLFSLVSIPFSLKIIWAPFVDTFYLQSFGRRKTWLVPVQLLCGVVMIACASSVRQWLQEDQIGEDAEDKLSVTSLTIFFCFLYFLMATQDIAVDGWALTMLSRDNVGYASVCNSIGQTLGVFMANQAFIALSDEKWCHRFLGLPQGEKLLTLSGFMVFWGYVFIVTTLFVWFFKKETANSEREQVETIGETCKHIWSICKLPNFAVLAAILLTCKVLYAPSDAALTLKFQEYGMPKSDLATISPVLLSIGLVLPAIASNIVATHPLSTFLWATASKMTTSAVLWTILQYIPAAYANNSEPSYLFFTGLTTAMFLHECAGTLIFISLMSFFSKISDPSIGGSYMTLLNTITNWGYKWPSVLVLWLIPKLTQSYCQIPSTGAVVELEQQQCHFHHGKECHDHGGKCVDTLDGYTILTFCGLAIGVVWIFIFRNYVQKLESLPTENWMIGNSKSI